MSIIRLLIAAMPKAVVVSLMLVAALPMWARRQKNVVPDSLQRIDVKISILHSEDSLERKDLFITMQRVEGGSYLMGATLDQTDRDISTNKPAHLVFLSPYYIATTEVTNALWKAVMPEHESLSPNGYPTNPVSYVSWNDCQEFVRRLDSLTGLPFRLPTEAEWEYAARGGAKSQHFRFAGSNVADSVGWTYPVAGNWTHPVGRKRPNELGLYDMTGNVAEWCQDRYGAYQLSTTPNPCGADTGRYRIARGGSYDVCVANSHLSVRRWYVPEMAAGYIGLRVTLTLPNDPMLQPIEEPALTRNVKLSGKRLRFVYVEAEQPYYISDEVECSLWRRIMQMDSPEKIKNVAVGMSREDRVQFAEFCSRAANVSMQVASAGQIATAEQQGVIPPFQPEQSGRKQQNVQQVQQKRRRMDRLSPWAELVGVRVVKPEDPVLWQLNKSDDDSRPLRLVILVQ